MGRAPNPGGPQRVTAHVVPRAKPFSDHDEEEKTTIESQWEEEASTTVEQGDVAEKIRALGVEPRRGGTNITSTGTLDEPTVDEQHMSAITPVRDIARLQIAQGNDAGQEIEIRPGKTYTIGRSIDNDVVLTDIAVSRKHFDLRFEDGAWVIVDRGSGNGTVVNGNLEDNPFMLANGDVIEIGNTVFRFDQPSSVPRPQNTMELDPDDEEMSTVAGKPLRADLVDAIEPALVASPRPARAKTLPPPTPLRAANASQPPPLGYPPLGPQALPQPASALSMPQMASRSPLGTPGPAAPVMLGAELGVHGPAPVMQVAAAPRPGYGYPQATEIPPHSVHAQMLLIQTQNRRGDGSTLHVPPTPYDSLPMPPRYQQPQLSKRTKLVLAGVGLAVFAAVMTIAVVKSGNAKAKATAAAGSKPGAASSQRAVAKDPRPTVVPIQTPAKTEPEAVATTVKTDASRPTVATTEPAKATITEPAKTEPAKATITEPARTEPAKTERTRPSITRTEPRHTEPKRTEPRHTESRRTERREARRDTSPAPKRVASAIDPEDAKNHADGLYRAKKFSEASAYLASAAKKADDGDARELRRTSDMYAKLGRALAVGTAPATKSTRAFEALRQAQNYDRNVGNAYSGEIRDRLEDVAPRAALSYVAAKDYPSARSAMLVAQQFGASENVRIVALKLESAASDLYNEAMRELRSDPAAAKDKLRRIKSIVDSKSTWYQRAQKQLAGS